MTYEDTASRAGMIKGSVRSNQRYHCTQLAVVLTVLSVISGETFNFGSAAANMNKARAIVKKVLSVEQAEGVGARVRRSIGRQEVWRGQGGLLLLKIITVERSSSIS